METPITAEAVFSHHAVAAGLRPLGDESIDDYVGDVAGKHKEAARCLREGFSAATIAQHADVRNWLTQAREHIDKPFPK
jgi:hypothetical protein